MAPSKQTVNCLKKDYMEIIKDPIPYITAHPEDNNILVWHYVIQGPDDSPYKDGIYHGVLEFPDDFPLNPPAVKMLTPNGRFECGVRLCLSISDYHPESWSPVWTVSAVLNGLFSFMLEETPTLGSIKTDIGTKRKHAIESWIYNLKDEMFCELFPDLAEEAKIKVKKGVNKTNQDINSNSVQE